MEETQYKGTNQDTIKQEMLNRNKANHKHMTWAYPE